MKKLLSMFVTAFFICNPANAMSLNVHDSDLRATIMLVARTGGLNISVDDSIGGKISISLANTEPKKILEIIAKTKNLNLIQDGNIFIMTSNFNTGSLMKSYLLPIQYGDAEILRKAVIMSLDPDTEKIPDQMSRKKNSDGSFTYNYSFKDSDGKNSGREEKIRREERVLINPDVNALILFGTESEYERAKNILETMDIELKQVLQDE